MEGIRGKIARVGEGNWEEVESFPGLLAIILSKLPVETLLVCKSVSKRWYDAISTPYIVKLQLSRCGENLKYIIFPHNEECCVVKDLHVMEGDGKICQTFTIPSFEGICTLSMICAFNGLICCTNDVSLSVNKIDQEIRICNPATREVLLLPKGSLSAREPSLGVAFKPGRNGYKIYRFFCESLDSKDKHHECEVYSSETRSWRGLGRVAPCPIVSTSTPGHSCVEGKVYWLISSGEEDGNTPGSILSVDWEGNFTIASLPGKVSRWSFLVDFKGFISLVAVDVNERSIDIWQFKYLEKSWSLKASVSFKEFDLGNINGVNSVAVREDEILFIMKDTVDLCHSLIYNVALESWTEINISNSIEGDSPVAFPFCESLLSCYPGVSYSSNLTLLADTVLKYDDNFDSEKK